MDIKDFESAKQITDKAIKTSNSAIRLFNDAVESGDYKQAQEYYEVAKEASELAQYTYESYVEPILAQHS
jgi:hypothetical protein